MLCSSHWDVQLIFQKLVFRLVLAVLFKFTRGCFKLNLCMVSSLACLHTKDLDSYYFATNYDL